MENILVARKRRKRREKIKLNLWCYLFMSLTLVFYAIFQGWPIICSVIYSTLNWSGMTSSATYVGLGNYAALLSDQMFWNAFFKSFQYTALTVPLQLAVSLFLAYMLNNEFLKMRDIYRMVFFAPVVTTTSVVGIIMVFIWSVQGPVNQFIDILGVFKGPVNFLGTADNAMPTVVLISVWKDCGTYMIYWLAGLQSVPKDLYEAATVDGAGRSRTFFSIVLPLIAPMGGVIAVLCTINSLKVFDIVKAMTDGGPFYSTDVVATYVYRMAFSSDMGLPRLGYASAAAILFGVIVIIIGAILNTIKGILSRKSQLL